jgi:hypothetical protein
MKAFITFEKYDQGFRTLEKRQLSSRSFTKGLIALLYVFHAQIPSGSPYAYNDEAGNSRNLMVSQWGDGRKALGTFKANAGGGSVNEVVWNMGSGGSSGSGFITSITVPGEKLGVVIGTGVTAVSPTDTSLVNRITHGRGVGQMEYGGSEIVNLALANPNGSIDLRRYFTNLNGNPITVNECGIYAAGCHPSSPLGASSAFCIARDLVSPGVIVANTEILRVIYTLQITV